jgi:hypothetical protein
LSFIGLVVLSFNQPARAKGVRRCSSLLLLLMCICITPAYGRDEAHTKLSAFVKNGEALYERAMTIINTNPTSQAQVVRIYRTLGVQWQIEEHQFQASFWAMQKSADLPDDMSEGIIRIGQFDNFIFDAVGATYICHNTDAHWRLKIAGQILEHAKLASEGRPDPDWDPDLDSAPEDETRCR